MERHVNPLYYDTLDAFKRETGIPTLVNTSFNHAGEPIVNSLEDALDSARRCRLDALAICPYLGLSRAAQPAAAPA